MTYSIEDWRKALSTLVRKTSEREITWEDNNTFKGDAWTEVDRAFEASVGNKVYVVSDCRRRQYIDEDEFIWMNFYQFDIYEVDQFNQKKLIATAPEDLSIITRLYEMAESNFAFESGALDGLLDP